MSVTLTAAPRRRLSSRRGSHSAPDPYGVNLDADTARGTSARITIVPVAPPPPEQPQRYGPRDRGSWGSNHSASSNASAGAPRGRLSFALSSFTPLNSNKNNSPSGGNNTNNGNGNGNSNAGGEPGSPVVAPASPGRPNLKLVRSNSSGSIDRTGYAVMRGQKLTPEQICDLAVSSMASPGIGAGGPLSPTQPHDPKAGFGGQQAPTPFLLLEDDHYLPFLDRAMEVTALVTSQPTSTLMALLSQTFPADMRAPFDIIAATATGKLNAPFGEDPAKWNFAELSRWLQTVDRDTANDREWVMKTRRCVLARSELIWSRLKAALGVPPELEEEEEDGIMGDEEDHGLMTDYDDFADENEVFLEPIYPGERMTCVASPVSVSSPSVFNAQNSTGPGMESIGEGAEDEEEGGDENEKDRDGANNNGEGEGNLKAATLAIQGLRISAPMVERERPVSPSVPMRARSHSSSVVSDDSSSVRGVIGGGGVEMRRRSSLAMAGPGRVRRSTQQEQGTGAPLFPSSFATLGMGPSLVANNPALRSGPRSSFRPGIQIHALGRRGRYMTASGSVTGGWDTDGNDYALSLGSGSERSFR